MRRRTTAQRHDTDGPGDDATTRVWQVYADELGIPGNETIAHNAASSLEREPAPHHQRRFSRTATGAGALLGGIGIVVIALIAGSAFRSGSPPSRGERAVSTPAATTIPMLGARPSGPGQPAGETARSASAVAPPTETLEAPERHRSAEARLVPAMNAPAAVQPAASPTPTTHAPSAPIGRNGAKVVYRINFDFASDQLADASRQTLDEVVSALKRNPEWRMVIEGHTDAHGTLPYNQALSERRAEVAKAHLVAAGIAPDRLRARGLGADRPMAPNASARGSLNRRVELHRP